MLLSCSLNYYRLRNMQCFQTHICVLLPRFIIFAENVTGVPEFCMMAARAGWLLQRLTVRLVRPVRKHKRIR